MWVAIGLLGAALGALLGASELLWQGLSSAGGLAQTSLWILSGYAGIGALCGILSGVALWLRGSDLSLPSVAFSALAVLLTLGFVMHWNDTARKTAFVWAGDIAALLFLIGAVGIAVRRAGGRTVRLRPWVSASLVTLVAVFGFFGARALGEARALAAPDQLQRIDESGPWGDVTARLHPARQGSSDRRGAVPRLLFIGIDGATWGVMQPLVEAGRLPHIAALMERGVAGVLRSEDPMDSPVVWTSILTGKTPDRHGIDAWETATSANRRARALWSILAEHGDRTLVVNVPGTFPAEDPGDGVFLAGFPNRLESYTNIGVMHTTRSPEDFHWPPQRLEVTGPPGASQGVLEVRDQSPIELQSALGIAHRALTHREVPMLGGRAFRRYASIPFAEVSGGVELELAGQRLRLAAEQWSPWVGLDLGGDHFAFRVRVMEQGDALTLYTSPLFLTGSEQRLRPENRGASLEQALGPYVIEGMGVAVMEEPRVLEALAEHLFGVARDRFRFVEELVATEPFDAVITIFTLTDRIQHAFWGFLDASSLHEIEDPIPYPPTGAEIDRQIFAALIPAAYEMADAVVGRLVALADPETLIVLASDHGFESRPHRIPGFGAHGFAGIYLVAGGPVPDSRGPARPTGPELRLYDLVPTIEAALELPLALDLDGEVASFVRSALESAGKRVATTESYEREGEGGAGAPGIDETMKGQLESLGYIE